MVLIDITISLLKYNTVEESSLVFPRDKLGMECLTATGKDRIKENTASTPTKTFPNMVRRNVTRRITNRLHC